MKTMKKNIIITSVVISFALSLFLIFTGCVDNDELPVYQYPEQTVGDFSPTSGRPGTEVTINGSDFGTYKKAVTVFFNGVAATQSEIVSVSDDKIVVKVPEEASNGKINVKVWTYTKEAKGDFTFIPGAKVSALSPANGEAGDQISILGESFGTDPSAISVFFKGIDGDVEATIVSINETEIVVTVPSGVTGEIKVLVGSQEITGPVFVYPIAGIEYLFDTDGNAEGWVTSNNSTNEVKFNVMKASFDMSAAKRRADFVHTGGMTVHAGVYPIVAIKIIDKPASGNFILDTNLGTYKNGSNNWDGILDDNVYYYDLRSSFGSGNVLSQTETTELSTFQWKVADITTNETSYFVDWVKSFTSVAELEAYVAEQNVGQNNYGFTAPERTVTAGVLDDWIGRANQAGTTTVIDDGFAKVSFTPSDGVAKSRADFNYSQGGKWGDPGSDIVQDPWHFHPNYPIYAIKIHFVQSDGTLGGARPAIGTVKYDRLGDFNNTYADSHNVLWVDARTWSANEKIEGSWWAVVIADILSKEKGYWIDWHRTYRSIEEMEFYLGVQ